jgi:Flp pilus assembly protein TadD
MRIVKKLQRAVAHHQKGELSRAVALYREVTAAAPGNADAWHLLGLALTQGGRHDLALEPFRNAHAHAPTNAAFCRSLASAYLRAGAAADAERIAGMGAPPGSARSPIALDCMIVRANALTLLGRLQDALAVCDVVVEAAQMSAAAHLLRGAVLHRLDRHPAARSTFRRMLAIAPDSVDGWFNLATVAHEAGERDAFAAAKRTVALHPRSTDALVLAGNVAFRSGEWSFSERSYRAAISLDPTSLVPLENLVSLLNTIDRAPEAATALRRLVVARPDHPDYHALLGIARMAAQHWIPARISCHRALALSITAVRALMTLGALHHRRTEDDAAARYFRCAVALTPGATDAWTNLGMALRAIDGGATDTYLALSRGPAADPSNPEVRHELALVHLHRGDLARGWAEYEARFRLRTRPVTRSFRPPLWDGTPLSATERLLVWAEQGVGDEIIYGSMLPDLARRGIRLVLECDERMQSIFGRALPDIEIAARRDPPDERLLSPDVVRQIPLVSLARWLRPTLESFPANRSYLVPDSTRVRRMREVLLGYGPGLKVGVAWRSSRADQVAQRIHTRITDWGPILTTAGVVFINLQYGDCARELDAARAQFNVDVRSVPGLDLFRDLEGVLALGGVLDLVISTTTTAFCLPAMAGVPAWILMHTSDHVNLGADRIPWFPKSRLFVRRRLETWNGPIEAIASELRTLAVRSRERDAALS